MATKKRAGESDADEPGISNKEKKEDIEAAKTIRELGESLEKYIMGALGKPPGFVSCRAIHLFKDRYRVNISVEDGNTQRISDSFYARNSADGCFFCEPSVSLKYIKKK